MSKITKDDIAGFECKHAIYVEHQGGEKKDLLVVKEIIHLKNGKCIPNLRKIENFERPYWVTKPAHQNHKDKKLFESRERVQEFKTTQINLKDHIARSTGRMAQHDLRVMARNQYLYGADITTPAIVKRMYKERYPEAHSLNSVAVLDLEADVVYGTEQILSGSLTFKDRALLVVNQWFLGKYPNAIEAIQKCFDDELGEHKEKRGITLTIKIVETPAQVACELLRAAHEWSPDIVAIWNMAYDIPKMMDTMREEGIDPCDWFCDPSIPPQYRNILWQPGQAMKVTASGRKMPLSPAERWNVFEAPASFYFLDAMCVYQKIRVAKGKESYALDAVLEKILGIRKLKFKEADDFVGIGWHQFMQKNYKIQYLVYNLFDCISVELLDEKTMDLCSTVSLLSNISEYSKFPSQPRRTCDNLHYHALENGHVIATTSDKMEDELDALVVDTKDWIVTLPAHQIIQNGLCCLKEFPKLRTQIRLHVGDIDVAAAYPTGEDILNISHETTWRELVKIEGVSDKARRRIGINLTGGPNNAVEICREVYKLPNFETFYDYVRTEYAAEIEAANSISTYREAA